MSDQNHGGESPADVLTVALDKALERWEAREISLTYRGRDPLAKIPGWVAKALPRYGAVAKRMAAAGLTDEQLKTEHVRWESRPIAAGAGNSALEAIEAMAVLQLGVIARAAADNVRNEMPEWVEPPPVSREEAATRAPTVAVRGRSRPVADLLEAGAVVAIHSGGLYKVEIESRDAPVLARLGGETLKRRFRVVAGDHATVELTLHDPSRGRIVRRL